MGFPFETTSIVSGTSTQPPQAAALVPVRRRQQAKALQLREEGLAHVPQLGRTLYADIIWHPQCRRKGITTTQVGPCKWYLRTHRTTCHIIAGTCSSVQSVILHCCFTSCDCFAFPVHLSNGKNAKAHACVQ